MPFKNPGAKFYEKWYDDRVTSNYKPAHLMAAQKIFLRIFKDKIQGMNFLDIGCGTGEFLYECQKLGGRVWGCDFDTEAIAIAKNNFGMEKVYAESFEDFLERKNLPKFDFITLFEVIEHIDNHPIFLKNVYNISTNKAVVGLSTPSRERFLPNNMVQDFPPHHLSRFNQNSLIKIFKNHKLYFYKIHYFYKVRILLAALFFYPKLLLFKTSVRKVNGNHHRIKLSNEKLSFPQNDFHSYVKSFANFFKNKMVVKNIIRFFCIIAIYPLYLLTEMLGYKNGSMLAIFIKNQGKQS